MKRCLSLALVVLMLVAVPLGLASCGADEDSGAIVNAYYVGEMFEFDPARALVDDDAMRVLSLLYEPLFSLNEKGKLEPALAEDYKIIRNVEDEEYQMEITMKQTTWSDGNPVKASDVVYAWQRIIEPGFKSDAAPLLYEIEGAYDVKTGAKSSTQGDFKVEAVDAYTIRITFRNHYDKDGNVVEIDYDAFLRNLTSVALSPVRQTVVSENEEHWGKRAYTIVTNGPFTVNTLEYDVGEFTLERNRYYNYASKDLIDTEDLDKYVRPYQIITDWYVAEELVGKDGKTVELAKMLADKFADNSLFLMADLPLSLRGQYAEDAEVTDALSTMSILLNTETMRPNNGLLSDPAVRRALSQVLDREAIAKKMVFAAPATGLISHGVFDSTSRRDTFREADGADLLSVKAVSSSADITAAKKAVAEAIASAGNNETDQAIASTLTIAYLDNDVNAAVVTIIAEAWAELGITVKPVPVSAKNYYISLDGVNDLSGNQADKDKVNEKDLYVTRASVLDDIYDDFAIGVDNQEFRDLYEAKRANDKRKYWTEERVWNSVSAGGDLGIETDDVLVIDALLVDYQMLAPDAFAPLAAFSSNYNGYGVDITTQGEDKKQTLQAKYNATGYRSEKFDALIAQAFAEKDLEKRATILHNAEKQLLEDMPIIPLTFGQHSYVKSDLIRNVDTDYYGVPKLTEMKMKNYQDYLPVALAPEVKDPEETEE